MSEDDFQNVSISQYISQGNTDNAYREKNAVESISRLYLGVLNDLVLHLALHWVYDFGVYTMDWGGPSAGVNKGCILGIMGHGGGFWDGPDGEYIDVPCIYPGGI
jgi:hypothetical protein